MVAHPKSGLILDSIFFTMPILPWDIKLIFWKNKKNFGRTLDFVTTTAGYPRTKQARSDFIRRWLENKCGVPCSAPPQGGLRIALGNSPPVPRPWDFENILDAPQAGLRATLRVEMSTLNRVLYLFPLPIMTLETRVRVISARKRFLLARVIASLGYSTIKVHKIPELM